MLVELLKTRCFKGAIDAVSKFYCKKKILPLPKIGGNRKLCSKKNLAPIVPNPSSLWFCIYLKH